MIFNINGDFIRNKFFVTNIVVFYHIAYLSA